MGALGLAGVSGVRLSPSQRRLDDRWRQLAVEPRGSTSLGVSFRPLQAEAFGLDPRWALRTLLSHPFQTVRLAACWNRIEPEPGAFRTEWLDWQVDAAERAGKQIILCVGAVKAFGYPEYYVPSHLLAEALPEGSLVDGNTQPTLLAASTAFVTRVVERYRDRGSVVGWQVEQDAVDPLGVEHSWRLALDFVAAEVEAVRTADPSRPIVMNGFLPTSPPVRLQQWWRTRDQGDSLVAARRLADVVGIDYYPRHALTGGLGWGLYLDGRRRRWPRAAALAGRHQRLMISEGQAEPWEALTVPPSPDGRAMYSCPPEDLIANYNRSLSWARRSGVDLEAYLFWGAEYWLLRQRDGDPSYLEAFIRVLDSA
ncbi:beta-galactosidase [Candidatus Nephthysia bennettiae]|uniref:Beta-galactosidase n=1 Tax=Candidatus Nephthysia bennettiae TaxID=3127016 RepID=A0A934K7C0_9BACT|nr:beta-galactosidase [Candidatus Dormibacteraeota bacterium]MBJ7613948.1 beta-galactosidase [Candidatus Dormibacteraeota bacterium]